MEDQMIMGALPSNLRRIQGLRVLNLAGNLISGTVPRGYYSLSNLEFLNLESNNLSGTISNRIGRLRSLLYLQLEDNDFSGSLPQSLTVIPLGKKMSQYHGLIIRIILHLSPHNNLLLTLQLKLGFTLINFLEKCHFVLALKSRQSQLYLVTAGTMTMHLLLVVQAVVVNVTRFVVLKLARSKPQNLLASMQSKCRIN